jgi:hypothetical protein
VKPALLVPQKRTLYEVHVHSYRSIAALATQPTGCRLAAKPQTQQHAKKLALRMTKGAWQLNRQLPPKQQASCQPIKP